MIVQELNSSETELIHTDELELESVRPKHRELTPKQAAFVAAYVANGQSSARGAMIKIGAKPDSAGPMGYRNLRNPVILEAIRDASGDSIKARLPELIQAMIELALNEKISPVARVSAFRELADRAGMAVQRGPMVQINNGMTDPKAQAQAIIAEIWTEKNTREARKERTHAYVAQIIDAKKSGIAGGMADIIDNDLPTSDGQRLDRVGGGERRQGPIPVAHPIPPSPNAPTSSPRNGALDEWRAASRRLSGRYGAALEGDE